MKIVMAHGIINPSNSPSTKNSSVTEMDNQKANENITYIRKQMKILCV